MSRELATAPAGPVRLSAETLDYLSRALAPNTVAAYRTALQRLSRHGLTLEVLDDPTLADHIASLGAQGLSASTCAVAVAAARKARALAGWPDPAGPITRQVLQSIRRGRTARTRGQARGIQWSQADAIAAVAAGAGASLAGRRDAALVAVMSDAMLRVSELAALRTNDIRTEDDGTGRVVIHRSKTDQAGEGAELFLGRPTMERIREWVETAGIHAGFLFRRIRRGGHVDGDDTARPLVPFSVRAILRRRAAAAGVEGRISGHSLRVGAAQSLVRAGGTLPEVQQAGRWKGARMPAHYARGELAGRGAVARLRYRETAVRSPEGPSKTL